MLKHKKYMRHEPRKLARHPIHLRKFGLFGVSAIATKRRQILHRDIHSGKPVRNVSAPVTLAGDEDGS